MAVVRLTPIWQKQVEEGGAHLIKFLFLLFSISRKQGRVHTGQLRMRQRNQSTVGQRPEWRRDAVMWQM